LKRDFTRSIKKLDAKLPQREYTKIYEKNVPLIKLWKITLSNTRKKYSRFFNLKSPKIKGIFASPRRKKGSGFGIAYSIIEKNIHKAAEKLKYLNVFSFVFFVLESIFI